MNIAKLIAFLGLLAMGGAIIYGFTQGDFNEEGKQLLSMPWGIVSMMDLYTGFTLFSVWIVYREKSIARSLIWILLMMTLGFFAGSLYAVLALFDAQGDWKRFWMGARAELER